MEEQYLNKVVKVSNGETSTNVDFEDWVELEVEYHENKKRYEDDKWGHPTFNRTYSKRFKDVDNLEDLYFDEN